MVNAKLEHIRTQLSLFGWKIINDWSFSLGSLVAYYLLASLVPIILCLFAITSLIFGNDAQYKKMLRDRISKAFPKETVADVVDSLYQSLSKQAGIVFVISFIVAIFTSSRLFIGIDDVLTILYRVRERRILQQNVHAIKMLLAFIIFMPIIIISSSIPAIMEDTEVLYQILSLFLSAVFSFLLCYGTYYCVPLRKMRWSDTWCGALFVTIGFQITFFLFPLFVRVFMTNYVGTLGFVIIALVLLYLLGLLIVIGAQINAFFFDNIQPLPFGLGNCISAYADNEHIQLIPRDTQSDDMSALSERSNLHQ